MKAVWKFPVLSTGPMWIDVPDAAKIIMVDRDPATGLIAFWAEVDTQATMVPRHFEVVGTGRGISADAEHVGSVIIKDLVWHLYEIKAGAPQ